MGINVGMAFTGQGLAPVIVSDGRPSSYDFYFQTTDGIDITLNVDTDNESRAETIRKDLEEKMSWTRQEAPEIADPTTALGVIGQSLVIGAGSAMVAFAVGIVIALMWAMADLPVPAYFGARFEQLDNYMAFITRTSMGIGTFILAVDAFTGFTKLAKAK